MDHALLYAVIPLTAVSSLTVAGLLFRELIGDFRRLKPARKVAGHREGTPAPRVR